MNGRYSWVRVLPAMIFLSRRSTLIINIIDFDRWSGRAYHFSMSVPLWGPDKRESVQPETVVVTIVSRGRPRIDAGANVNARLIRRYTTN